MSPFSKAHCTCSAQSAFRGSSRPPQAWAEAHLVVHKPNLDGEIWGHYGTLWDTSYFILHFSFDLPQALHLAGISSSQWNFIAPKQSMDSAQDTAHACYDWVMLSFRHHQYPQLRSSTAYREELNPGTFWSAIRFGPTKNTTCSICAGV